MERDVVWSALAWPGMEHLGLREHNGGTVADSLMFGVFDGQPYRIWYRIHLDRSWTVTRVRLLCSSEGGQQSEQPLDLAGPSLDLWSDGAGNWTDVDGNVAAELQGCIDVDISATPFTNTLPIRRLALAAGDVREIAVVYIALPEVSPRVERQRYTCLQSSATGSIYQYESLSTGFKAEITADPEGLVSEYPRLFTRVWST